MRYSKLFVPRATLSGQLSPCTLTCLSYSLPAPVAPRVVIGNVVAVPLPLSWWLVVRSADEVSRSALCLISQGEVATGTRHPGERRLVRDRSCLGRAEGQQAEGSKELPRLA